MEAAAQEQRHVVQHVADGEGFDIGNRIVARFIRDQRAVLSGRERERPVSDFVP